MSDFDDYLSITIEQAKRFLEKANLEKEPTTKQAYYKAAFLFTFTFLEGQLNSVAQDFYETDGISILDQSILQEKELILKNGAHSLGKDRYFRTDERIEFFFHRFGNESVNKQQNWWGGLKQCVSLRNRLVHPRSNIVLNKTNCEHAIQYSIEAVDAVFNVVYGRPYPLLNLNLNSQLDF